MTPPIKNHIDLHRVSVSTDKRVRKVLALTAKFIVGGNSDSRQVAIRRSLLQVFCAYFAKYFTHPDKMTRLIFIAFCAMLALFPTVSVSRSIKPRTETRKSVVA